MKLTTHMYPNDVIVCELPERQKWLHRADCVLDVLIDGIGNSDIVGNIWNYEHALREAFKP